MKAWMLQRVSAVYMALYIVYFIGVMVACKPTGFEAWNAWMTSTTMALATATFFLALLGHAWVGMRDVFLDYIKPFALRLTLLALLALGLLVLGIWVVKILLTGSY